MTDVRELIERGRYTAQHGVFDAVDACKYATAAELTDALTAALEREEALRVALARHDAKIAECPIDRPRCVSKPPEACPRCFAKRNEVCVVKHDAAYRLISEVRDALPENTNGN